MSAQTVNRWARGSKRVARAFWNKQYFAEAGLDPNRGPATLAEYEEYYRRLTRRGPDGTVTQIAHPL